MYLVRIFLGWLILSLSCFALGPNKDQPINIIADVWTFNYKTKTNLYEGHVKIDQGTSHLNADRLTTKNNEQHKMEEVIAYGLDQQAEYWTTDKPKDHPFHAKANIIKLYPQKSLVILEGNVVVLQGENSFHGPIIIYNIKDQIVKAPASKKGRASIVIQPELLKA